MAKELPYFRFEPSEWDNGNIQMCSRDSKGLFMDLCSIYWTRLGELPYALALQKLCNGNKDAMQELINHEIFGVIDGQIVVDFLDEQLLERGQVSVKRREAAHKRWSDANALQLENKSNANRIEDKREEEKKKEKKKEFVAIAPDWFDEKLLIAWNDWLKHRKELKKKMTESTARKQIEFLRARGPDAVAIINLAIEKGWTGLYELQNKQTNGIHSGSNKGASGQVRTHDTRTIDYDAESSFK